MIVMLSNSTGATTRELFDRFPGRIAHLMSPDGWRKPWGEYALDNGAFPAFTNGTPWDAAIFRRLCEKAVTLGRAPRWVVVPDVVGNREDTLRSWEVWAPTIRSDYGFPLAFACQDGMTPADVPDDADVLFVGGTTAWKWESLPMWCATGRRVHVGRVNSPSALFRCQELGVESIDGTGWPIGGPDNPQWRGLVAFLESDGKANHREQIPLLTCSPGRAS